MLKLHVQHCEDGYLGCHATFRQLLNFLESKRVDSYCVLITHIMDNSMSYQKCIYLKYIYFCSVFINKILSF